MRLTRVTEPSEPAIGVDDVKAVLSLHHGDHDAMIEGLIGAVTRYLDGPGGILGRAIVHQVWRLELESWPDRIVLPVEPVASIEITWFDAEDVEQTLGVEAFEIIESGPAARPVVAWNAGVTLPGLGARMFPVRVAITAGAADGASVDDGLRQAMSLLAAYWYENRGAVSAGQAQEIPFGISAMLARYRVML
ncbi:MAG: head-tail connector protein [Mameliella sp.]|nr:head-tail connector protein [Mameliella sp.]